jgi:hypothetical protein
MRWRRLAAAATIIGLSAARGLGAQVSGQSFEVVPETRHATVGDTVTLRFRVRLDERDLLFDTVPEPVTSPVPGVRILSIDKLARTPDRIFHGKARLTFYRTGRQPVPRFMLPFMRAVKGLQRGTLASDSAFVDIAALLPAGNPALKDIREFSPETGPGIAVWLTAALAGALALVWVISRRRRRPPVVIPATAPPVTPPPQSPYARALSRLDQIAEERWPARRQVDRHYEGVVDALREYLDAAAGVPAGELTTEELLWALPPELGENGRREALRELLHEADLVKFARLEPKARAAERFLERCRVQLGEWHAATVENETADALR